MRAFLLLNEKAYTAAAEIFKALSEKSPDLAPLLVNLATANGLPIRPLMPRGKPSRYMKKRLPWMLKISLHLTTAP